VDMMRVIETGNKVKMVPMSHDTLRVDTQYDLDRVRELMGDDKLMASYR
jgi:3-deoxy-manno-octulosonate cytidylyltransferase (CMP-KDO synthetase)